MQRLRQFVCPTPVRHSCLRCLSDFFFLFLFLFFFFFCVLLRITFFQYLKVSIFFLTPVSLQVAFYSLCCYLRSFPATQKKGRVQQILSRDFLLLAYYRSVVCMYMCVCKCLCVQFFFPLFFSSMPFCKDFNYLDYLKSLLHPAVGRGDTLCYLT